MVSNVHTQSWRWKPKYQQETKYNGVKMDEHEVCSDYT